MNQFEEHAEWAKQLREAVNSGSIGTANRATLIEYSTWLCHRDSTGPFGDTEYEQICELVRLHLLRTMIEAFEERSKVMQRWMLFFAFLAIVASLMPYFILVGT